MAFLSNTVKISNAAAALVLFLAWYVAAAVTVAVFLGLLDQAFRVGLLIFLTVISFLTIVFIISRMINRTDIIDVAWGPAFVVAAIASFALSPYQVELGWNVQTILTLLVAVWAARLSISISRRFRKHPEDKRYVELRRKWKGNEILNTYLRIFLVQAALATVISHAVIHINLSPVADISGWVVVGLLVWLTGFFFEAVGDFQLRRFLALPANKGKLMTSGLWKYTRHPNYFGETVMWWGIFFIALTTPYGWLTIVTPVVMTYLLVFVSGVPPTEKLLQGRPGWAEYKKRTSMFIPLPPKA